MKTKSTSTEKGALASRVDKLEEDVEAIGQTLADLIQMLKNIPDPPCPPMCSEAKFQEKGSKKKKRS